MKAGTLAAMTLIFLSFTGAPVFAQQRGIMPHVQSHAINPSLSLSAPSTTPLQQQMQDDYATNLMSSQRQLLRQNPSGVSRQEMAIGHELNSFTAPR